MKLAVALVALILSAACGGSSDPIQPGNNTVGSIRGNVTDNTGAAVANATVALSGNAQAARTTTSGTDGVYTFTNVPAGTYTLAVTPPTGFTVGAAVMPSVTVASGAEANASAIVLTRATVTPDSCVVAPGLLRPDFGGLATPADRTLFAYDVNAPLNLQKNVESTVGGVQISAITYSSPDGGTVTGLLFDPVTRSSLRPGIVLMHGLPGNARQMGGYAHALAQFGAVVIAIDAPHARRGGQAVLFTNQDRTEQIQLIKDLQRAVDVLRAQVNVDDDRIAYVGVSYGGAMGALFAGIERRIKTAVLVVADGGLVTHYTGPEDLDFMASFSCASRLNWFRSMAPIEPIRFIGHAPPTPLLLQNGRFDTLVPMGDAQVLHAAVPQGTTIRWYDADHGLNQQAVFDRHNWLVQQIGLDPLQ
jgi:dienelactone hydrolase